jgi:choline dehydrogenase-like flavoprotein
MAIPRLVADPNGTSIDVQQTAFSYDVMGRYVCNSWSEIQASQGSGGFPFDAVVIGAGMFGGYCAEKLYRLGEPLALRVLVLEAGAFLLPSHIQNLPQRLGGNVGGPLYNRKRDDSTGTQNVVWGMPWISNELFPGLAYCIGGRSLFWGGWSPRLTPADLSSWPPQVASFLNGTDGTDGAYADTEKEIGAAPTTEYISGPLFDALLAAFNAAKAGVAAVSAIEAAPLAVLGSPPSPGLFPFDKFSSGPFLIDAVRNDSAVNNSHGDISRRIFLMPRTQVLRLNLSGNTVTSLDLSTDGQRQTVPIPPTCAVVIANGTIEATRLALDCLGVGSTQFGSPRVGNLMAHLRSNITVRIKRSAFAGLGASPDTLETAALLVRGTALGRRFHLQVTAAALAGANPEQNLFSMVPDIDNIRSMTFKQDPNWIVLTLRGIGEMQDQRSPNPDPAMSWIDLSGETDRWGGRRAYVNLVATAADRQLWTAMDKAAFDLAARLAQSPSNIEYWNATAGQFQAAPPQPDVNGRGFWQDGLGTTHHEAGTLFMGSPGNSVTDLSGKLHDVTNAYVAGPAVFPALGSANPSLTALSLARGTAQAIVAGAGPVADAGFAPLSLDPKDWTMVRQPNSIAAMRHYGKVLETFGYYGLYWYTRETFANFALRVDWRVGRAGDNSGVYIRIPAPNVANPLQALQAADGQGHEIQIDEIGFDSQTNTAGHAIKRTGAIYDLQAPTAFPSNPIGTWNRYLIEARGSQIKVTLNEQLVNTYQSSRQASGYLALQAHHYSSRVQFRNLQVKKLP